MTARCEGSQLGVDGCLPCPDHFIMCSLQFATGAELTARCEGSQFGVTGGCPPCPDHYFIMCPRIFPTGAELAATC